MGTARRSKEDQLEVDHNQDRYPKAVEGLRRIVQSAELPDGPIERLEVTFLASGEATYRVWEPRAEVSEGGYLAAPSNGRVSR